MSDNADIIQARNDVAVADRAAAEARIRLAALEATAAEAPIATPAPEPAATEAADPVYRIRLLPTGDDDRHALHRPGAVLAIVDSDAVAAHAPETTVTRAHAFDLVRLNRAEFVDAPPPGMDHIPHADTATAPYFPRLDMTGGPALR